MHLKEYPVEKLLRLSTPLNNEKQQTAILVDHLENYIIAKECLPFSLKTGSHSDTSLFIVPICADFLQVDRLRSRLDVFVASGSGSGVINARGQPTKTPWKFWKEVMWHPVSASEL